MLCKNLLLGMGHIGGLTALSFTAGLSGCGTLSQPQSARPSPVASAPGAASTGNLPLVVGTSSVVCDVTRQIAADTVDLKCLIAAGTDPHEYAPRPEDSKAIEQAKLVLYGGYNFEHTLITLIKASPHAVPKIAVYEVAVPNPQQFEDDGKTVADPHVFHNARNGVQIAVVIGKSLSQLEPGNASLYAANTKKLADELTQIDAWIKSEIATIPVVLRKLVTTHDAFGYYSKAYGIPVVGALQGIGTDEKPTPTRVAGLVKEIRVARVPTIFAESTINPRLIETVAKEAKVKVADQALFADGLGEKGSEGETYQKFLIANTKTIVEGLGGTYTPFQPKPYSRLTGSLPNSQKKLHHGTCSSQSMHQS